MAQDFELLVENPDELPEYEASWIKSRVDGITKTLDQRDEFPDVLFDGRPYDEEIAHLRLLQFHRDSIDLGFSNAARQALLDAATKFGLEAGLPEDVIQANWLKASQEER